MNNIISQEEKDRIDTLCMQHDIDDYTINGDGSIDVNGGVRMNPGNISVLPLVFNKVRDDFFCTDNLLTSLEGCPKEVGGGFFVFGNRLTSLEYCPTKVGDMFDCRDNYLTSLEGCPKEVGGYFLCENNDLTSLKGCPNKVGGTFKCTINKITSLEYLPTEFNDGMCWFIDGNNLPTVFTDLIISNFYIGDEDDVLSFEDDDENFLFNEGFFIFLKYQHYFDVWTPKFSIDNMKTLLDEIKDGLK
jgi:hypothetical protein